MIYKSIILLLSFVFLNISSFADKLEVVKYNNTKLTIATINTSLGDGQEVSNSVVSIILNNLNGTQYIISEKDKIFNNSQDELKFIPNFKQYRYYGIIYTFVINVKKIPEKNQYFASFEIFDNVSEQSILTKTYSFTDSNLRKVAHVISDNILQITTGLNGYFQSKIYFAGRYDPKSYYNAVYVIDQDGFGENRLTHNKMIAQSVSMTQDKKLLLLNTIDGMPKIEYISNLGENLPITVGIPQFKGLAGYYSAHAPCHKNSCISFSVSPVGSNNANIYINDYSTGQTQQLTYSDINTAPSFSPDDSEIVYEGLSKTKRRNLYKISKNGINKEMLVGEDGAYMSPSWSPDGKLIAFIKIKNGLFNLGTIKPDGRGMKIIQTAHMIENPIWLPNSDAIMVLLQPMPHSKPALTIIDLEGHIIRKIDTKARPLNAIWVL